MRRRRTGLVPHSHWRSSNPKPSWLSGSNLIMGEYSPPSSTQVSSAASFRPPRESVPRKAPLCCHFEAESPRWLHHFHLFPSRLFHPKRLRHLSPPGRVSLLLCISLPHCPFLTLPQSVQEPHDPLFCYH